MGPGLRRDDDWGWSRTHRETAFAGLAQLFGEAGEFDGEAAGVARVDDLLDPEGFGGAEWRAQLFKALLDLGAFRGGVGRGVDLGPVGGFDAALQRQGTPAGRQPG